MDEKFKKDFEAEYDSDWENYHSQDNVDLAALEEKYDTSIDSKATAVGKGLSEFPLNYNIKPYPGEKINDKNATFLAVDTEEIEEIEKDAEEKELHLKEKVQRPIIPTRLKPLKVNWSQLNENPIIDDTGKYNKINSKKHIEKLINSGQHVGFLINSDKNIYINRIQDHDWIFKVSNKVSNNYEVIWLATYKKLGTHVQIHGIENFDAFNYPDAMITIYKTLSIYYKVPILSDSIQYPSAAKKWKFWLNSKSYNIKIINNLGNIISIKDFNDIWKKESEIQSEEERRNWANIFLLIDFNNSLKEIQKNNKEKDLQTETICSNFYLTENERDLINSITVGIGFLQEGTATCLNETPERIKEEFPQASIDRIFKYLIQEFNKHKDNSIKTNIEALKKAVKLNIIKQINEDTYLIPKFMYQKMYFIFRNNKPLIATRMLDVEYNSKKYLRPEFLGKLDSTKNLTLQLYKTIIKFENKPIISDKFQTLVAEKIWKKWYNNQNNIIIKLINIKNNKIINNIDDIYGESEEYQDYRLIFASEDIQEAIRGNYPFSSDVGFKTDSHKEEIFDAPKYGDGVPTENEIEDAEEEEIEEENEEINIDESMVQQFGGGADGFVPEPSLPPTEKEIEDSTWDADKEYYITDKNKEESEDAEERKSSKEKLDTRKERLKGFGLAGHVPDEIADRKKDDYSYKRSQKRNNALSKPHREKPVKLAKNKIRENIQKRLQKFGVLNEMPIMVDNKDVDKKEADLGLLQPIREATKHEHIKNNIYKIDLKNEAIFYIVEDKKLKGAIRVDKFREYMVSRLIYKYDRNYPNLMWELYNVILDYYNMDIMSDITQTKYSADVWKKWYLNGKSIDIWHDGKITTDVDIEEVWDKDLGGKFRLILRNKRLNEGPVEKPNYYLNLNLLEKELKTPIEIAEKTGKVEQIGKNVYKTTNSLFKGHNDYFYIKKEDKIYGGVKTEIKKCGNEHFIEEKIVHKWGDHSNLMLELYSNIAKYTFTKIMSDKLLTNAAANVWRYWLNNQKELHINVYTFDLKKNRIIYNLSEEEVWSNSDIRLIMHPLT